jgi:hypothetical protein
MALVFYPILNRLESLLLCHGTFAISVGTDCLYILAMLAGWTFSTTFGFPMPALLTRMGHSMLGVCLYRTIGR